MWCLITPPKKFVLGAGREEYDVGTFITATISCDHCIVDGELQILVALLSLVFPKISPTKNNVVLLLVTSNFIALVLY